MEKTQLSNLSSIRKRIVICILLLLVLIAIGTTGYWFISGNFLDSLYMTVITAATVGYGEVIDLSHNPAGRIFTIGFIVLSLLVIAVITSMMAASILELELSGFLRRRKMNKEISKLTDHYIICGAGETGIHIIHELAKTLHPFVVIDRSQERLEKLNASIPNLLYINGDATEDDVLLSAGIECAIGVVAVLPSDKDNLYITVMAKQYNDKARIVALGIEDKALNKLKNAGADAVVSTASIGGMRMASEMIRPSVVKFLDTMLRQTSVTYRIEEIAIGRNSPLINKKLAEIPLRDKYGLLILAIMRSDSPAKAGTQSGKPTSEEIIYTPPLNTVFLEGFIVVVLGEAHNIKKAQEFINP